MKIESPPGYKNTQAKEREPITLAGRTEKYREEHEDELKEITTWLKKFWLRILDDDISASVVKDFGSIGDGGERAANVTVTGAAMGDYAIASFSLDVSDMQLDAQVTAADTVTCTMYNNTGGAIDLASGTLYVRVFKRTS